MDTYNRGYNAGLSDGLGSIDQGGNDADGLGEAGSHIGIATVKDIDLPAGSQAAGFYAVAYDFNGQTVISYRGTNGNNLGNFIDDAWNSYLIGAGNPFQEQVISGSE